MKKTIIAILGVVIAPSFVFAQGYTPFGDRLPADRLQRYYTVPAQPVPVQPQYQSQPSFAQPRVTAPAQAPRQTLPQSQPQVQKPQITEPVEIEKGDCSLVYEDPKKPVGAKLLNPDNNKKWYYRCVYKYVDENGDEQSQIILALSKASVDAVINARTKGASLYFDPTGNNGRPLMVNDAPDGFVPMKKPSSGPTDSGKIEPEPEKPALPFRFVPVNPPAKPSNPSAPSSNPEVEANRKAKEENKRLMEEFEALKKAFKEFKGE